MVIHPAIRALIQARTSPTFHAVTRWDNLYGGGKVAAFTLRHKVGAENGSGAGVEGRLWLCTSCASRMNALSGSKSNDGITATGWAGAAAVLAATGVCFGLVVRDTMCPPKSEGPIVISTSQTVTAVAATSTAIAVSGAVQAALCLGEFGFEVPLGNTTLVAIGRHQCFDDLGLVGGVCARGALVLKQFQQPANDV